MRKLKLYKISEKYIDFLRETDPVNVKHNKGEKRPYIGIILEINNLQYFALLASPKPNHLHMKNSLDYIFIHAAGCSHALSAKRRCRLRSALWHIPRE